VWNVTDTQAPRCLFIWNAHNKLFLEHCHCRKFLSDRLTSHRRRHSAPMSTCLRLYLIQWPGKIFADRNTSCSCVSRASGS
jgi:hypothetical protein